MRLPNKALFSLFSLLFLVEFPSAGAFVPSNTAPETSHRFQQDPGLFASLSTPVDGSVDAASPADNNDSDFGQIEFPPPLGLTDRLKRAATFWSTAVPIVANYYGIIGKIQTQELLGRKMTEEEIEVCSQRMETNDKTCIYTHQSTHKTFVYNYYCAETLE